VTAGSADLARARAFLRSIDERTATRVETFRFGTAYFHDELPRKWSFNFLRIEADAFEADELIREADALQGAAGLGHRMVVFFDEQAGAKAAPSFERSGWRIQPEAVMAYRRAADHPDSPAREISESELHETRVATIGSFSDVNEEASVRQLVEAERVVGDATDRRSFGYLAEGRVVSFCDTYSNGAVAQIENVNTLPEFRNRGYAQAVLAKALAELAPEHELTFLLAHDDDWPKELYRRIGFEIVGLNHVIIRPAPA
jgi:ribosomal protein S18 acetylase RimI-like enzyme